jgi:hypothetical protein
MDFYSLPKDMQEEVKKLAREHTVNIEKAIEYYMMGGYEHADYLCTLGDAGLPDYFIRLQSHIIWEKKNKKLWEELKK